MISTLAIIIWHDMGGGIEDRLRQMHLIGAQHVEIRGECVSACTLFLGLPDVCVWPAAQLGFHGPRTALPGIPLPRREWERVTAEMAAEYPPAIREWFMVEARYHVTDYLVISGAQAIQMGARACE